MKSKQSQEFKEITIGDACPFVYGKSLPMKKRNSGRIPVYGSNGIVGWHNESFLKKSCIIIGRKGSIGKIHYSQISCWPIDTTFYIEENPQYHLKFIFYLLKFTNLENMNSDTSVPGLNRNEAHAVRINIPGKNQQIRISRTLENLDTQIENLQKQNKILEQIAQTVFKSWFVDYDGITEFEGSEWGKIPKGWQVGKIKDAIQIFDNQRIPLSTNERTKRKGQFPYYGATSIIDNIDDYIFDGTFLLLGEDGSVIHDDGTPFVQYVDGKIWVNNHAHVIQGKKQFSTEFIFLFFKKLNVAPYVTGTTQLKINQFNLLSIPIIIPNNDLLNKFNQNIKPFFACILKNKKSISRLSQIRDILLPKLMSGKVRI